MKKRVKINLTFTADLDQVPGWGHTPEDWVKYLQTCEVMKQTHYNVAMDVKWVVIEG